MRASINAMQQQMAFMAMKSTSLVQQQQQPTPQQQQQPPQMYGSCGNYGNRNNFMEDVTVHMVTDMDVVAAGVDTETHTIKEGN
eukprot:14165515-Ditylum_brightwellii.AAC.1